MKDVFLILFLVSAVASHAQSEKAQRLYDQYRYTELIQYMEKQAEKREGVDLEEHRLLGRSYAKIGSYNKSLWHYNKIVYSDTSSVLTMADWLQVAQANLKAGRLEEARLSFARSCFVNCEEPEINLDDKNYFQTTPLEKINSSSADFYPYQKDDKFYFISDRDPRAYETRSSGWTGESYSTVFVLKDEKISVAKGPFLTNYYLGSFSYSDDGMSVFMTCNKSKVDDVLNTDLYISSKNEKGKWSKQELIFPEDEDQPYSNAHPIFIERKNILIFTSDRPGGFGGTDLYYSKRTADGWSSPTNFGEVVNGLGDELFPYYSKEFPNRLFFSSDSHLGYGGLDIYYVDLSSDSIDKLSLLPRAINSSSDDFGLYFLDSDKGYVTSNRDGEKSKDDIYSFELSQSVLVSGYIVNNDGVPLPNKKLSIQTIGDLITRSITTDEEGYFKFEKLPYEKVFLKPENENGSEMFLRTQDDLKDLDREKNLILQTSGSRRVDSVALASSQEIVLVLETLEEMQERCVRYEDGEKVVKVAFLLKDKDGNFVDRVRTDENGCLLLKKLYDNGEYLELQEEMVEDLQMRFKSSNNEISVLSDTSRIILKFGESCVEYESGEAVSDFTFLVKDVDGNVIDTLTTNEQGCFKLKKLFPSDSYLDIPDEYSESMDVRIVNKEKDEKWKWQKEKGTIILRTKENCIVFAGGDPVANKDLVLKTKEGETLEEVKTNEEGCFKLKKLYGSDTYFELEEEDVVFQGRLESQDMVVLDKVMSGTSSELKGSIISSSGAKISFEGMEIYLLSENGIIQQTVIVNENGSFEFKKLLENQDLFLALEEDNEMMIRSKSVTINGEVTHLKENYENRPIVYLLDENGEKYKSSDVKSKGLFKISFDQDTYEVANNQKTENAFDELKGEKENITIVQNIYFANGKWDLNLEAEKVLDELVMVLKKHPDLKVNIKAHTDANGSAKSNLSLSQNRANSVINYLSKRSISNDQYTSKGYGETQLINHCEDGVECTPEEHAQNRRIEFEFEWN